MIDLVRESEGLHIDLVSMQVQITRETVEAVLECLKIEAPEILVDEIYRENRGKILEAMAEAFAEEGNSRASFIPRVVFSKLVKSGVIKMFEFPQDLAVTPVVLVKVTALASVSKLKLEPEKYPKVAFIILNSSTVLDLRKFVGAMCFDGNAVQLLMPLFWQLCKIDTGAKERLLASLRDHPVLELNSSPTLLEDYCFNWGTVGFVRLALACPATSMEMRQSLEDAMVGNVLKILQEYLGW